MYLIIRKAGKKIMDKIMNKSVECRDNQDNVKLCISADTYLESVFYNLCAQDERKVRIYYEWQNNKNRYVHQTAIIAHDFPHYSVHDQEHSRTIIEAIEMFLGKWRIERLGIGNAWLLLNAAYGHDIGMVIQHQEILDLWRDDKDFKNILITSAIIQSQICRKHCSIADSFIMY